MNQLSSSFKSFFGGAFALIALFLIVAHSGGFAQSLGAATSGAATDFATLQGRST